MPPGREDDHVSRHDLFDGNLPLDAVAESHGLRLHDREQLLDRAGRPSLLPEAEQAAREDDRQDDRGVDRVVEEEGQPGGKEENQDQGALELSQQERQLVRSSRACQAIGTEPRESLPGFGGRQAAGGGSELLEQIRRRYAPERGRALVHVVLVRPRGVGVGGGGHE